MARVAVIGGGAAGMMAAARCALRGIETHLYEKNSRLGRKILITGKGRCNITNASDVEEHLQNIPGNPYFMYSSYYMLDADAVVALFNELGVATKVERGNRVFPVSDRAADVASALEKYARRSGVKIHTESCVEGITVQDGAVCGIKLANGLCESFDGVIAATGGLACPATGSDGDGYRFAREAGHSVTKLLPSLVPLRAEEAELCASIMGLSLKNIAITIKDEAGKPVYRDFGEMLFTHYGVSGPVILSASRHITRELAAGKRFKLYIDMKPALDEKTLDNRLLRDFEKYINKAFKNSLDDLLPQKLIPAVIELSGIDRDKKVNAVTKEERRRLLSLIKAFPLTLIATVGFNEAVVTCGGVNTDEINPSTMQSRLVDGLHFAGEVLDVDGYTGGFNLQIAFSTGYCAGESILKQQSEIMV